MPKSPCAGCPPCCPGCIFDMKPAGPATNVTVLLSTKEYGCIRPDAGPLVIAGGTLGMMRSNEFHPVTQEGVKFLRQSGNELAAHC